MAENIPNTIPSEGLGTSLAAAMLAAFLCVYGALFVSAAWNFAPVEPRYTAVARGKIDTTFELDVLIQALRASPWRTDLARAAFVQMLAAQKIGLKSLRATTRLAAARRDLRLGLRAAPSDAYAWTRLSVTELHLGDTTAAANALSLAVQIAPGERKLTGLQFDLAVALWPALDAQGRTAIHRRLVAAGRWPGMKDVLSGNSAQALRTRLLVVP